VSEYRCQWQRLYIQRDRREI